MAESLKNFIIKKFPKKKYKVLTHCNTGFLACGSIGTALGVIELMAKENLVEKVWVDETRPYLQGSRLTAFELGKLNIDHEIVVEGAASLLMQKGMVDFVVVGADRIVSNGDTANKIGTSNLAVICQFYKIPFFVVAPLSSFDLSMKSGDEIKIELRSPTEITELKTIAISPSQSKAYNPSFDISKGELITAISCEKGVYEPPYLTTLRGLQK
jgi:methylthioribose-1-phosphate isomerase